MARVFLCGATWRRGGAAAALAVILLGHAEAASPTGARDPWLWPFAPDSPWNMPIGADARYSAADAPVTEDLVAAGIRINAGQWSHPLYLARDADPLARVHDKENDRSFTAHVPAAAKPDPMGDAHMYVVEPNRRFVLEMYGAHRARDGAIAAVRTDRVDLYGSGFHLTDARYPGVRAMDASGMGGLIRAWELRAGAIHHAMTFLLPPSRLRHGPVWPSAREDYWGFRDYHGHVPIGQLIAIPADVDLTALHLSPAGLALAHALQDYGAYCADSGGDPNLHFAAENAAADVPELAAMREDLERLHPLLRAVLNNTAATPGGGGAPRQPPAPPLR